MQRDAFRRPAAQRAGEAQRGLADGGDCVQKCLFRQQGELRRMSQWRKGGLVADARELRAGLAGPIRDLLQRLQQL